MEKIKIMVNGLPGNMAETVMSQIMSDDRFEPLLYSLTGPEITDTEYKINSLKIKLIPPDKAKETLILLKTKENFIIIDYTHPTAVNINANLYCECNIPFVMGTTGGDRDALKKIVEKSSSCAVIAPNMAKQIVALQTMLEFASNNFPNLFQGYDLKVKESHQKTKADTSGTAKAIIKYFKEMGASFSKKNFYMERDPLKQKNEWKIPEENLSGHGFHTYTLYSNKKDIELSFTHNITGRNPYGYGTVDAVLYLFDKIKNGAKGEVFSMIDVLKAV
jgi:4-hydroxy-tetrahydrodipicolinate reductase